MCVVDAIERGVRVGSQELARRHDHGPARACENERGVEGGREGGRRAGRQAGRQAQLSPAPMEIKRLNVVRMLSHKHVGPGVDDSPSKLDKAVVRFCDVEGCMWGDMMCSEVGWEDRGY
jgi:hypothetical protein